jgi:hypothetical protein
MNGLDPNLRTGTLGELLVQLRLLQFGVQAAPPLKDTGNDLIAIRGSTMCAIQVKTTEGDTYDVPDADRRYHILAAVRLVGEGNQLNLEESEVFLIPRLFIEEAPRQFAKIHQMKLSDSWVDELFPPNL